MARTVKGRKRTKDELRASVEMHHADAMVRVTQAIAPWVGWAMIGLFTWMSIHDLAGKITIADISVLAKAVAGGEGGAPAPAWYVVLGSALFGFAGMILAKKERKLRKDVIERLHHYQEMWESGESPSRTSSKLTPRGDTRPEDK